LPHFAVWNLYRLRRGSRAKSCCDLYRYWLALWGDRLAGPGGYLRSARSATSGWRRLRQYGLGPDLVMMAAVLADHGRTHLASPAFRASLGGWMRAARLSCRLWRPFPGRNRHKDSIRMRDAPRPRSDRRVVTFTRDLGQSQNLPARLG